jgi:TonB family protein
MMGQSIIRLLRMCTIAVPTILCFSGCAWLLGNPRQHNQEESNVEQLNRGLLDTSVVDTVQWHVQYDSTLQGLDTTSRSTERIRAQIAAHDEWLLARLSAFFKPDTARNGVDLAVSPKGSVSLGRINGTYLKDTSASRRIDEELRARFDGAFEQVSYWTHFHIEAAGAQLSLRGEVKHEPPGGRSKRSIMDVVMPYLSEMRTAYNRRLAHKSGIKGKVFVKFAIDQYGRVIFAAVVESTLNDRLLSDALVQQIKNWKFPYLPKEGDITEVVYPFVLSQ